jgi:hypothetical protein
VSSWRASSLSAFKPAQKTSQSNTEDIALETRSTGSAPSVSRLPLGLAHNPLLTSPPQHHGDSIRGRHPNEPPGRLATALRKPAACIQPTRILGCFGALERETSCAGVGQEGVRFCMGVLIFLLYGAVVSLGGVSPASFGAGEWLLM